VSLKGPHLSFIRLVVPTIGACALAATAFAQASAPSGPTSPPAGFSHLMTGALEWFEKGGPIMYPIALASLVGLAFVIERSVALRRKSAIPQKLREDLTRRLDALDVAGAVAECEARPCSLARIVRAALLRQSGTIQEMEKGAEDAGVREIWQLRRNVRPVGIVASLAPLLGLLGTISGMIGAFETMSVGATMGNPGAFAGAIREALFTTFFGLSVAIPMLPCYHWLNGKAEAVISEIEEITGDLLLRLRHRTQPDDTGALGAAREDPR